MKEEDRLQKSVMDYWKALGVPGSLVAAIPNKKAFGQPGLTPGLPDLLVVAPGLPCGFIELKTAKGTLSDNQEIILNLMDAANVKCAVCRGMDETIAQLESWGAVRRTAA